MVFTPQEPHSSARLVVSSSLDPWYNLACEEYLLETLQPRQQILYLYRNSDAVVIGRHQNPWKESSPQALDRMGIPLLRRISGGGTVFHDLGNLNFSFIQDRASFDKRASHRLVQRSLSHIGIQSELNDRGDLLYGERKFSGNALCYRTHAVVHHGTLLVRSDLRLLSEAIAGLDGAVETHAVASAPAAVANLADQLPGLTVETVQESLEAVYLAEHPTAARIGTDQVGGTARREELAAAYRSWDWLYGKTPSFRASWALPLDKDTVSISFQVRGGHVVDLACSDTGIQIELAPLVVGSRFGGGSIHETVAESAGSADGRLRELSTWLLMQGL